MPSCSCTTALIADAASPKLPVSRLGWRSRVGRTGDWHGTGAPRTGHCSRTGDGAGEGVAEVRGHRQAPPLLAQGSWRALHRPGEEKRVTIPNVAQVACEYRHQTGEDPPHRNLGLPSLTALLRSLPPTVCRLEQTAGWACFQVSPLHLVFRGGVMVYRGGRGGWRVGGQAAVHLGRGVAQ